MTKYDIQEKVKEAVQLRGIDAFISKISPSWAVRRQRSRVMLALGGAFVGARLDRGPLQTWNTSKGDADTDILYDLPVLRERCRDLERNHPIAHGVLQTKCMNVIGPGLKLRARINRDILNVSENEADAWERKTQNEWQLFWNTQEIDISRTCTGPELEWIIYKQIKLNGEVIVLFPRRERTSSINPYQTKIQIIEADRLCNKDFAKDTNELAGGVKKDSNGAPIEYHILKQHPGNLLGVTKREWDIIPAFGAKSGLRNVLHIYRQERPGQTRGIPDFTAIIEPLKQLGRYANAELEAAAISSCFTIFIRSNDPEVKLENKSISTLDPNKKDIFKVGMGTILQTSADEEIDIANPGRPNQNFDPFVQSIIQQIGVALNLPHEVVMKRYLASYSAARAAMLDAWKYFITEREWIASKFHQQVYEIFLYEAVASGRISAPGFFSDPLIHQAYCGSDWIGPAKGMINEGDEVEAAAKRIELGITTLDEETAQLTGGDWEQKHPQRVKEKKQRVLDGLEPPLENQNPNNNAEGKKKEKRNLNKGDMEGGLA